ncbi:MAG: hypothetical protein KF716_24090 [Anaerolineae bacterium]|nr:hypothetical protein [Anaerolineae bacterium]
MDTLNAYSNKAERKRELVQMLSKILDQQHGNADILDKKAWDILNVASASFGIGAVFQIAQVKLVLMSPFTGVLLIVLLFYLQLFRDVLAVIRPMNWRFVPGGATGQMKYTELMQKYIAPDDDEYLHKLIVDFIGKDEMTNVPSDYNSLSGAIQIAMLNNEAKSRHLLRAIRSFGIIIVGLIVMAFVATSQ